MHTDPVIRDLAPGESASVQGALLFFEGSMESFYQWFCDEFNDKC